MADENGTVENIIKYFLDARENEITEGLSWYADAQTFCEGVATEYDVTVRQVAYAVAALSPRTRWEENKRFAEGVVRGYVSGMKVSEIKSKFAPTFASAVALAWVIVANKDYTLLTGRKVRSFLDNIINRNSEKITVDVWANRVWLNDLKTNRNITDVRYGLCEQDYITAFEQVKGTVRGLEHAYQLQAIVWVVARNRLADKKDKL